MMLSYLRAVDGKTRTPSLGGRILREYPQTLNLCTDFSGAICRSSFSSRRVPFDQFARQPQVLFRLEREQRRFRAIVER